MPICLTFDTDWMSSEYMDEFVRYYPQLPQSTFFIHRSTSGWSTLGHELASHPAASGRVVYGSR